MQANVAQQVQEGLECPHFRQDLHQRSFYCEQSKLTLTKPVKRQCADCGEILDETSS